MESTAVDDRPMLAALGVLAFALTDVSHEALGHGLATLAVGGKAVLLTTCYFNSSGHYSRWIPAAGGLMNLAVAIGSLAVLRFFSQLRPLLRYFLVLVVAFNLFFACGYPAYSGIARFGDWAAVISGLQPEWLWRTLLVVIAVTGYYASMNLVAGVIAPFAVTGGASPADRFTDKVRLRRITTVPYISAIILACLAGALNPSGWRIMVTAGLPAAAAAFGLTQMDHLVDAARSRSSQDVIAPMRRSFSWIVIAVIVLIFFVAVLGPGIQFH